VPRDELLVLGVCVMLLRMSCLFYLLINRSGLSKVVNCFLVLGIICSLPSGVNLGTEESS
jgi:hypothetical protein